jgi:hypothetical protein
MTLKELEALDVSSATTETLEAALKKAVSSLNPRIKNIGRRRDTAKNAYKAIKESGGLFSLSNTRSKYGSSKKGYRNALIREVARAQKFQKAKTGTVKGARNYFKESKSVLSEKYGKKELESLSQKDLDDLISEEWDEFHKHIEAHPANYWTREQRMQELDYFKKARAEGLSGQDLSDRIQEIRDEKSSVLNDFKEIEDEFGDEWR